MLRNYNGLNGKRNMTQILAAAFFLPLGLLGLAARKRGTLSRAGLLMFVIAMSLGVIGTSGCGGNSTPTVTAGSYTVSVVATVNGSTTTFNLNVTVQSLATRVTRAGLSMAVRPFYEATSAVRSDSGPVIRG